MEKPRVAIRFKFGGKEVEKKEKRETKRVISKYLHKEIQDRLKRKKKKMEHHSIQMIAQFCKSRKRGDYRTFSEDLLLLSDLEQP